AKDNWWNNDPSAPVGAKLLSPERGPQRCAAVAHFGVEDRKVWVALHFSNLQYCALPPNWSVVPYTKEDTASWRPGPAASELRDSTQNRRNNVPSGTAPVR